MNEKNKLFGPLAILAAAITLTTSVQAYVGSTTPKLHVSGRFLQDTSNKSVVLHGYMQPTAAFFNGNRYSDPTDWNNTANVAGLLNFIVSNLRQLIGLLVRVAHQINR